MEDNTSTGTGSTEKELTVQLFFQYVDELRSKRDDLEKALRELTQQTNPATNWDAIAKSTSLAVKLLYSEHQTIDSKLGTLFSAKVKLDSTVFDVTFK